MDGYRPCRRHSEQNICLIRIQFATALHSANEGSMLFHEEVIRASDYWHRPEVGTGTTLWNGFLESTTIIPHLSHTNDTPRHAPMTITLWELRYNHDAPVPQLPPYLLYLVVQCFVLNSNTKIVNIMRIFKYIAFICEITIESVSWMLWCIIIYLII